MLINHFTGIKYACTYIVGLLPVSSWLCIYYYTDLKYMSVRKPTSCGSQLVSGGSLIWKKKYHYYQTAYRSTLKVPQLLLQPVLIPHLLVSDRGAAQYQCPIISIGSCHDPVPKVLKLFSTGSWHDPVLIHTPLVPGRGIVLIPPWALVPDCGTTEC
jgi:hypothetical protein